MISFHPERVYEVKRLWIYKPIQQHPILIIQLHWHNGWYYMIQWEITNTFIYGYLKIVDIKLQFLKVSVDYINDSNTTTHCH